MKKLSIILLALAFAVSFAGSAMAVHVGDEGTQEGSLGISGTYKIDGESKDVDGEENAFFDDDLELVVKVNKGAVTAVIDFEISDDADFAAHTLDNDSLLDNYYIMYQYNDALSFKIGEYAVGWGRNVALYNTGGHNMAAMYSLDSVDLTGILSKLQETQNGNEDADIDQLTLSASFKNTPFSKLVIGFANVRGDEGSDIDDASLSLTGVDYAIPVGPVALSGEIASLGGDADGVMYLFEFGLEELVGFDLGINYFRSDEDWFPVGAYSPADNDILVDSFYFPLELFADEINGNLYNTTMIWLTLGYQVNDNLSVGAAIAPSIKSTDDDFGPETFGTEFDLSLSYQIADGVSYAAAYGNFAADDDSGEEDANSMWHRVTFKF
jgi:hypothetical protein